MGSRGPSEVMHELPSCGAKRTLPGRIRLYRCERRLSRGELEKSRVQREAGSSSQGYSAVTPGLEERSKPSNAQRTVRMSLYLSFYQVWTAARAAALTSSVARHTGRWP